MLKRLTAFALVFLFLSCFLGSRSEALSLGSLVVSPSPDGKFYAQININHETNESVQLYIASRGDYQRLNVASPAFLEDLFVQPYPALSRHDKTYFIIYTDRPVEASEFNLILKARSPGGVILKNYEVAQTGKLQLSLKNMEKEEEVVDLLGGEVQTVAPEKSGVPAIQEKPKKPVEKLPTPLPPAEAKQTPQKPPVQVEKPPVVTTTKVATETKMPDKNPVAEAVDRSLKKETVAWVSDDSGFYGPTQGGETLDTILDKLNIPPALKPQAQLLMLKDNPNLFKKEDNYVLEKGKYLTYADLVQRALRISPMDAYKDLNSLYGKGDVSVERKHAIAVSNDLDAETKDAWNVFLSWKESWEQMNIEAHEALFSKNFMNDKGEGFAEFVNYKKRIFQLFPNPKIRIKSLYMRKFQGRFSIYFQQEFTSNDYASTGGKIIKMVREEGKWKISYERFYASQIKEDLSPYTVHAASFQLPENAYEKVRELEKAGYNSFVAWFDLGAIGSWYRVFAERLTTKVEGVEIVQQLKAEGLSTRQTVLYLPYAIELLDNYPPEEIASLLKGLRPYSIYKLDEASTDSSVFLKRHVLLGGYPDVKHAEGDLALLKAQGIKAAIVAP